MYCLFQMMIYGIFKYIMRRNLTCALFTITFVTGVLTWEANKYRQPVSTQYKVVAYMCEEAYSEPCQTSKMRLLWKMVNGCQLLFSQKPPS